ncbi:hypothetical protein [Aquisediminimonas profunda]|uniref:hypothetical protein n=1 Tax=Aquisediminimonas profunda TaxID=1550733 RepID=UPI001C63098E|nr:hypothetical protein [Aquisediminimonas profunda]
MNKTRHAKAANQPAAPTPTKRDTILTLLALALPPRSLKSIICSIALPAWLLGHNPGLEVVCASYNKEFADQLSSSCRRIMLSPWYRRLFPATRLDKQAVGHLATTAGGKRYATSVGGTLTGMGADVIIVDDPMKPCLTQSATRPMLGRVTRCLPV